VQQVGIKDGTTVSIHVEGNTIVLSPARPKYTLSELLRTADPAQQADEVDWGEPVGAEFW
jgi:antitoxin MazE